MNSPLLNLIFLLSEWFFPIFFSFSFCEFFPLPSWSVGCRNALTFPQSRHPLKVLDIAEKSKPKLIAMTRLTIWTITNYGLSKFGNVENNKLFQLWFSMKLLMINLETQCLVSFSNNQRSLLQTSKQETWHQPQATHFQRPTTHLFYIWLCFIIFNFLYLAMSLFIIDFLYIWLL